ncbi:MAG: hypothetical protein K9K30_07765 [Burkholderiaceae bacterium]|nr:hypothetical protein [Sulfuritalea sp.]MCF8175119.1 hypothetical protein [Burkholderiaceae bacterium]
MLESNHPDPEIRARSNALLAESRDSRPIHSVGIFRKLIFSNFFLFYGGCIALGFAFWHWGDKISKEDLAQMDYCQKVLVAGSYGVTYDPDTKGYSYSRNKFDKLRRLTFLMECMPKSDPYRREREREIVKLKHEIEEAKREIEAIQKKLGM